MHVHTCAQAQKGMHSCVHTRTCVQVHNVHTHKYMMQPPTVYKGALIFVRDNSNTKLFIFLLCALFYLQCTAEHFSVPQSAVCICKIIHTSEFRSTCIASWQSYWQRQVKALQSDDQFNDKTKKEVNILSSALYILLKNGF